MSNLIKVASPPSRPLLVFDGDCGFCRRWVARWQAATGGALDCLPYQDPSVAARFPEIPPANFHESVQYITPDGSVCAGAEAVFRSLADGGAERWLYWCYRKIPPFSQMSELIYEEVAANRQFLSKLDRFFLGSETVPRRHTMVRFLFLRGLALTYLVAFVSLGLQVRGLIGSQGILPAAGLMDSARHVVTERHIGADRYHLLPTLAWWDVSDASLNWQCRAGAGLSVLLLFGVAPAPILALLWLLYLSLLSISGPFLSFQWDGLLLEAGFLAIFFAPRQWLERPLRQPEPSRPVLWLLRWLLFRLMFESGLVKLTSGDESWRHLTALRVHYETQPLPTWIGWHAHQLPGGFQSFCALMMFAIELLLPPLIFGERKARFLACAGFVFLQVLIQLTGNYTYFNLLTIVLCLTLLDDDALRGLLPQRFRQPNPQPKLARWGWKITAPLTAFVLAMTAMTLPPPIVLAQLSPRPLLELFGWLTPFRTFNSYGLFANMTQTRPEIILQGSNDGIKWEDYEFKYKPGDLKRRPGFVAPYQPRLDWQMWFAALGTMQENRWLLGLEKQLLLNSTSVTGLLQRNPFPDQPPKYIRAQLYQYHFTDAATRRATGQWWRSQYEGLYAPPISLNDFAPPPAK